MRQEFKGIGASRGSALGRARVRLPHVLEVAEEHIPRSAGRSRTRPPASRDRHRPRRDARPAPTPARRAGARDRRVPRPARAAARRPGTAAGPGRADPHRPLHRRLRAAPAARPHRRGVRGHGRCLPAQPHRRHRPGRRPHPCRAAQPRQRHRRRRRRDPGHRQRRARRTGATAGAGRGGDRHRRPAARFRTARSSRAACTCRWWSARRRRC